MRMATGIEWVRVRPAVNGGYEDVGMVMGIMEYEGWNGMIETFAMVCVAMHGHVKVGGMGLMGIGKWV